jgi:hypothetical protein
MQERSMHDWDYVTSAALGGNLGGNFRIAEQVAGSRHFLAVSATAVK